MVKNNRNLNGLFLGLCYRMSLTLKPELRDEVGVCSDRVELVPFPQVPHIHCVVIAPSGYVVTGCVFVCALRRRDEER